MKGEEKRNGAVQSLLVVVLLACGGTDGGIDGENDDAGPAKLLDAAVEAEAEAEVDSGDDADTAPEPVVCDRGVLQGPAIVRNDEELEELVGYTEIEGNLLISAFSGSSLERLSCLKRIGGRIQVALCESLRSLEGLHNIETVQLNVQINGAPLLTDLSGLRSLRSATDFMISDTALVDLTGLDNLTSLDDGLSITGNEKLVSLDGIGNLVQLRGVAIWNNPALVDIGALENLQDVDGLTITDNDSLTTLDGLQNLVSVTTQLIIENNPELENLDALSALSSVDGDITITANTGLTDLEGLVGITGVSGDLTIYQNASITSLRGLHNITVVDGDLNLKQNGSLISVGELSSLTSVGGALRIADNEVLTDVVFPSLDSVGLHLRVRNNPQLPQCDAFELSESLTDFEGVVCIKENLADGCGDEVTVGEACIS